jgi:hypothetical protein
VKTIWRRVRKNERKVGGTREVDAKELPRNNKQVERLNY